VKLLGALENDYQEAASLVSSFEGEPYGMIFPGCTFVPSIKVWPQERYGEVIRLLDNSGPRCWLICGGPKEQQDCLNVVQSIEKKCPDVRTIISCGQPLDQIAAALKGATLAMGCDNGGMHLAVAVNTPAISIVSGTVSELYFPWGNPEIHSTATYPKDCWDCKYYCIHESPMCIKNITPMQVAEKCKSVLSVPSKTQVLFQ